MPSAIASWYQSSYSTRHSPWARTRNLQVNPTVARADTTTSRVAAQMATGPTQPDELGLAEQNIDTPAHSAKEPETLFGPNIGVIPSGPAWTETAAKKISSDDELTLDVLKTWIAKSKESTQPTTTLQALVNLKRPTLRLSPLKPEDDEAAALSHLHALEFEYDCDAPQCALTVHAVLPANHPEAAGKLAEGGYVHAQVFTTTAEGGFGRRLRLEDQAILELGRLEYQAPAVEAVTTVAVPDAPAPETAVPPQRPRNHLDRRSRRLTFHLRRRTGLNNAPTTVAGPALAVVDAESAAVANSENATSKAADTDDKTGVRVVIRLVALGEGGAPLPNVNEQATYLHVVRLGAAPTEEDAEDTRPWVVKVVKREAVIGSHTFHLHEIYGLSAAPSAPAPTSAPNHSYPPAPAANDDDAAAECLLCLSAPREVVLLPCRHLVACRDCAVNMIEFGAGGTIAQPEAEEPATETTGANDAVEGQTQANGEQAADAAAIRAPTVQPRRKRKAKGWFCPVCRQPYTSLLRITTAPPTDKEEGAEAAANASSVPGTPNPAATTTGGVSGALGALSRPGFLRNWSVRSQTPAIAEAERAV